MDIDKWEITWKANFGKYDVYRQESRKIINELYKNMNLSNEKINDMVNFNFL